MRFNVRLRWACPNNKKAILRFTKNDSKNICRKNKCIRNQPAKLQSL